MRLVLAGVWMACAAMAQQPFYTDDAGTTDKGVFHLEVFDEFDRLQTDQYPNTHQNTANYKLNFGLTSTIELDVDNPYLAILRSRLSDPQKFGGIGDTNLGVKWAFHKETARSPALAATFYVEFPTGDPDHSLGSGLTDYWLNGIIQKHVHGAAITGNAGIVFAGNTSTGLIGIQTRGRVYTGGLSYIRPVHKKLDLGVEVTGALTKNLELSRGQLQLLGGGFYHYTDSISLTFGVLGGWFIASPVVGAQVGIAMDFPRLSRYPK